jgi:hypothetical protein
VPSLVDSQGKPVDIVRVQDWDNVFVFVYTGSFLACAALLWAQRHWGFALAVALSILPAAGFDLAENAAIKSLVTSGEGVPVTWAIPKWAFFFVAVAAITPAFIDPADPVALRVLGYLVVAIGLVTSGVGFAGVFADVPVLIQTGSALSNLTLLLGTVFFLAHWRP